MDIKTILIEKSAIHEPLSQRIINNAGGAEVIVCKQGQRPEPAGLSASEFLKRPAFARTLVITRRRGEFIKPFPSHPWYGNKNKMDDFSLITGYNCPASCLYCFTKTYFDDPFPTIHANVDEMLDRLEEFLGKNPRARISTGEFTDSLFLDRVTRINEQIADVVAGFPECRLELRTKMADVGHMPRLECGNITAAWSLNPEKAIRSAEPGTAGLDHRLDAALELHNRGYNIALRFDPLLDTGTDGDRYTAIAERIQAKLGWERVNEVFLGALRLNDDMMNLLCASRTGRRLISGEFIKCPDGKFRLHKFERIRTYKNALHAIRQRAPKVPVRLMMEPDYIRRSVLPPVSS